jgi:hypothetical protein
MKLLPAAITNHPYPHPSHLRIDPSADFSHEHYKASAAIDKPLAIPGLDHSRP